MHAIRLILFVIKQTKVSYTASYFPHLLMELILGYKSDDEFDGMIVEEFYNPKTRVFIDKAKKVHEIDKYDYSNTNFVKSYEKVEIRCYKHGKFVQTPSLHLGGSRCKKCSISPRLLSTEPFIQKARKVHGDRYDYSILEYKGARNKVTVVCPKHGKFEQLPYCHLSGSGCKKCGHENRIYKKTFEKFINVK